MRRCRVALVVSCLLSLLVPAGCGPKPELCEEFREYAARNVSESDLRREMDVELDPHSLILELEDGERAPGVLVAWMLRTELEPGYDINRYDVEDDLAFLADLTRRFCRDKGQSCGEVYVELWAPTFGFLYDDRKEYLHCPQDLTLLREVLRAYGTTKPDDIADTREGRVFLFDKKLAGGDPEEELARYRGDFVVRHWKWFHDFHPKRSVIMAQGDLHWRTMNTVGQWKLE